MIFGIQMYHGEMQVKFEYGFGRISIEGVIVLGLRLPAGHSCRTDTSSYYMHGSGYHFHDPRVGHDLDPWVGHDLDPKVISPRPRSQCAWMQKLCPGHNFLCPAISWMHPVVIPSFRHSVLPTLVSGQ